MVLANGTLAEFSPKQNPHLFNAVGACSAHGRGALPFTDAALRSTTSCAWAAVGGRVLASWLLSVNQTSKRPAEPPLPLFTAGAGVGRLGVITDLTFRIVPQQAVQRTLKARRHQVSHPGERAALHVAAAAVPATATLAFLATLRQWLMCCSHPRQ